MNTRQLNFSLQAISTILAIASASVLIIGFALPLRPLPSDAAPAVIVSQNGGPTQSATAGADLPTVNSFDSIFNHPLRVAVTDVPAPSTAAAHPGAVAAETPASPTQQLVLVGTIGSSLAMIRTPDGNVAVKGVGEEIAGAIVLAIRPSNIDLRIGGKTVTLEKPPETNDGP
jgi:hypothetical protein